MDRKINSDAPAKRKPGRPKRPKLPVELMLPPPKKARVDEFQRRVPPKIQKILESDGKHPASINKATLRDLFGVYREKSVAIIARLATHSRDERMRYDAAKYILDRTDGPVPREISGKDGAPLIPAPVDDRPRLAVLLGIKMADALGVTLEGEASESDSKDDESGV